MTARLIARPDVRQRLLAAVATVPAGERLNIARLRDALVDQADVLTGLRDLVDRGLLDPVTLRPPVTPDGALPSGGDLKAALLVYAAQHGILPSHLSRHLFGCTNGIAKLPTRRKIFAATRGRIAQLLAGPPPADLVTPPPAGLIKADDRGRPRGPMPTTEDRTQAALDAVATAVTGADLAAEVDALIAKHGLIKGAVGRFLTGSTGGVEQLRKTRPRAKTIAFVRAFLANPPLDELRPKRRGPKPGTAAPPRPPFAVPREPCAALQRARSTCTQLPPAVKLRAPIMVPPKPIEEPRREPDAPRPTYLLPAQREWCGQCERRVSGAVAGACRSQWCKLKEPEA